MRSLDHRRSFPAVVVLAACGLATGCTESPAPNPDRAGIDFSGIERFWEVVDMLSQDAEPPAELWDALFATDGYRALTESEFERQFFEEAFRLAYKPSLQDSLELVLEKQDGRARRLRHYLQVGERRDELEAFATELERSGSLKQLSRQAADWLPPPLPDQPAPVAVVIFDMDARGYDPIVLDLLAAKELDLSSFLAHESHHWYRNARATIDWDAVASQDADLLWTLYQIQGEGIADQIDKRPWLEGEAPVPTAREGYAESYLDALAGTPATLRSLDSMLVAFGAAVEAAGDTAAAAAIGSHIAELVPMSGHPTGYFMSNVILTELGKERLVVDVSDPIAFFRTYHEAARTSGLAPALSSQAMETLDTLRARYSP